MRIRFDSYDIIQMDSVEVSEFCSRMYDNIHYQRKKTS